MFTNLHCHSEYSLLDGAGSPLARAKRAKELGQNALSITDHGNLIGAPIHIQACNEVGIKPVVGVEAYFKPDRLLKDKEHAKRWHLLLLAKNYNGWKNLIKLVSESHTSGFYHKPCVDWQLLQAYGEDVICSSACISGYLPHLIQEGNDYAIDECIERHLEIFGDNYYLEIMPHDGEIQSLVNIKLANLSLQYDIPLLATGDSHYPYEDWKDTQDILLMIATGQSREKRKIKKEAGEDVYSIDVPLHMFSEAEMYGKFDQDHPHLTKSLIDKAIQQSQIITEGIEPFDIDRSDKFPKPKGDSSKTLKVWCIEGLTRIDKYNDQVYLDRFEYEYKIMQDMGVIDYMILVGNMVRWARSQGIRVSSGRGSAAGSLICYLTGITTIDPIAHELLFERFLNPNRKGMPDIDLDFQSDRRDDVKAWLRQEYGEDKVCDIVALSTYQPKGALKDVSRVLDVPFPEINIVTKSMPEATDVGGAGNVPPLKAQYLDSEEIQKFAKKYPEVWKHALRIEQSIKGVSKHAAGVIVTDKPITDSMPLMRGASEDIVTQWSSRASEDIISYANFPKIDILSLDGLTKQGRTIELISEQYGDDVDLDNLPVSRDPLDVEPEVMDIFNKSHTLGIFQFGSVGMTNFLRHVKPDRFEDLIASNALYRPGALEGGDAFKYGDRKKGNQPIEYWDKSVQPFLEKTYGIMVYQEQLQQIAQALGMFTPGQSDDMRKATSKLYRMGKQEAKNFMAQFHEQWMKGCLENGLTEEKAETVWERMIAFGAYSFNRSHSASYSIEAYKDAYLKHHYPLAFYASLLDDDDNQDKVVREARSRNIEVAPPDINESGQKFTITENRLLYGLLKVKYVGANTVDEIIKHRPYHSHDDFLDKVKKRRCNSQAQKHLLMAGAFDSFGLRDNLTVEEKRQGELDALGVALSGTGTSSQYSDIIEPRIITEQELEDYYSGKGAVVGGEITHIKKHKIKTGRNKGKFMAFANVSYKENTWDITFFRDSYVKYKTVLKEGEVVMIHGRKGDRGGLIVDSMIEIERLKKALEKNAS